MHNSISVVLRGLRSRDIIMQIFYHRLGYTSREVAGDVSQRLVLRWISTWCKMSNLFNFNNAAVAPDILHQVEIYLYLIN